MARNDGSFVTEPYIILGGGARHIIHKKQFYLFFKISWCVTTIFKDDENSLCDLSMQDECLDQLSPRSQPSSHGSHDDTLPIQFDSPNQSAVQAPVSSSDNQSNSTYRAKMEQNLAQKQNDINQLELVVGELNAELSLAQSKLTDLLHQQSSSQVTQSDQINQWRREQQARASKKLTVVRFDSYDFLLEMFFCQQWKFFEQFDSFNICQTSKSKF